MSEKLDYIFFGPVYESISKSGYKPKVPLSEIFSLFKSNEFQESPNKPKIYALGGIRRKKLKRLSEVGFDGVALLGSVWGSRDPVKAFKEFVNFEVGNSVFSKSIMIDFPNLLCITRDSSELSHAEQVNILIQKEPGLFKFARSPFPIPNLKIKLKKPQKRPLKKM